MLRRLSTCVIFTRSNSIASRMATVRDLYLPYIIVIPYSVVRRNPPIKEAIMNCHRAVRGMYIHDGKWRGISMAIFAQILSMITLKYCPELVKKSGARYTLYHRSSELFRASFNRDSDLGPIFSLMFKEKGCGTNKLSGYQMNKVTEKSSAYFRPRIHSRKLCYSPGLVRCPLIKKKLTVDIVGVPVFFCEIWTWTIYMSLVLD